ncbi:MAG: cupin domain-containing protein [Burkholderiaceae bacterium]|nr:cupin domain-containing protein [Burkholderiaceae bacterium]
MALPHAQPLQVITLHPAPGAVAATVTTSLLKTPGLQLIRLVLGSGQSLPEHHVPGDITIHCLSGRADVRTPRATCALQAGTLVMLPPAEPHAVQAHEDSVLLVTLVSA